MEIPRDNLYSITAYGDASYDSGTVALRRVYSDSPVYRPDPFADADQAERSLVGGGMRIKSMSVISNRQYEVPIVGCYADIRVSRSAVLRYILKRLLCNAVQAQRNLVGQQARDAYRFKVDVDAPSLLDLAAKTSQTGFQSELLQLGRVQFMRDAVDISGQSGDLPCKA